MRRGRSGIGSELVPLVLILASLAGSLALVIAIHRRFVARSSAEKPVVAVIAPPTTTPPKPMPIAVVPVEPEVADEPDPPPPQPPEDLTPKALAKLVAAEADQLLEASKADRKAAELEAARKAALLESERWRRRESLVRLQIDSLETKVHKLETSADEMALERDALEKELEARKALVAQARSRPSTAILPHRGQNGTWRRPIVVECVNGMAIIRPQNISFGLLELAMGFGPSTNPFVATIAREAIRIQGSASPDGQLVTPYIFFLVRPDGIRTYYEARGRLEALGITFGYELADQDWDIDFPDLDDVRSWDGSAPIRPIDTVTRSAPSGTSSTVPDFGNLPDLGPSGGTPGSSARDPASSSEFTWPSTPKASNGRVTLGGNGSGTASGGIGGSGGGRGNGPSGYGGGDRPGGISNADPGTYTPGSGGGVKFPGGTSGAVTSNPGTGSGPAGGMGTDDLPPLAPPRELSLGGPITPLQPGLPGNPGNPGSPASPRSYTIDPAFPPSNPNPDQNDATQPTNPGSLPPVVNPRTPPGDLPDIPPPPPQGNANDPSKAYVLPSPSAPDVNTLNRRAASSTSTSPDQSPPVRHIGPFSKPLAAGVDPSLLASLPAPPGPPADPTADYDPSQPDSVNPGSVAPKSASTDSNSGSQSGIPPRNANSSQKPGPATTTTRVIGPGDSSASPDSSGSPPPPLSVGIGSPGPPPPVSMPPLGSPPPSLNLTPPPGPTPPPSSAKPPATVPSSNNFKIIDRKYEIVVVCNARGVIVQPGGYRVTSDALKGRDGLLKTQVVSLVKAKRMADPKLTIEPNIRFLVQPGGEKTYWTARSQFLLSGLDWPMTTQVADSDHLKIIPSESW